MLVDWINLRIVQNTLIIVLPSAYESALLVYSRQRLGALPPDPMDLLTPEKFPNYAIGNIRFRLLSDINCVT
jgi:hypothetical protein